MDEFSNSLILKSSILFWSILLFFSCNSIEELSIEEKLIYQYEKHENKRVASLIMDDLQYKDWVENNLFKTDQEKTMQLTKDIYKEFPDNYDFILLILNENSLLNNFAYHGLNRQVSHKIRGIRNPVYTYYEDFDWGPSFGSNYKLQSITQINYKWVFKTGPLLHELMHTWGNDAIETEAVVELGTNITSIPFGVDNGSHWGFTGGNIGGQLGGFKQSTLEYLGSNTYLVEKFYPNHNNTLD